MSTGEEAFSLLQEQEIEQGRKDGLSDSEISLYARKDFNYRRMSEFRMALRDQLPMDLILSAAHSSLADDEIHDLFEEYREKQTAVLPVKKKKIRFPWIFLGIVFASVLAVALLYANVIHHRSTAAIVLKNESVRIPCGQEFDPSKYVTITGLSDGEYVEMPEKFTPEKPQKEVVVYQLHSNDGVKQVLLQVEAVDEEAPRLFLKTDETEVIERGSFQCQAFVESAFDETDGDLSRQVKCSNQLSEEEEQEVVYTVSDHSGNTAEEILNVHLKSMEEALAEYLPEATAEAEPTPVPTPVPQPVQPAWTPVPAPAEPVYEDVWEDQVITYSENVATGDGGSVSIEHSN